MKVYAEPNFALIKYWGKIEGVKMLPAVSSFSLTLGPFLSSTELEFSKTKDSVSLNGELCLTSAHQRVFDTIRALTGAKVFFHATSVNNFPTASGLSSSSSGLAALAFACVKKLDLDWSLSKISALARVGSISASRSVFPGFVSLRRKAKEAQPIQQASFWPELKALAAVVSVEPKLVSSTLAMELSQKTSPLYAYWRASSQALYKSALKALQEKNFKELATCVKQSYHQMFAVIHTANPSVYYWDVATLALLKDCQELKTQGVSLFETMDAGAHLKLFFLDGDQRFILSYLRKRHPGVQFYPLERGQGVSFA